MSGRLPGSPYDRSVVGSPARPLACALLVLVAALALGSPAKAGTCPTATFLGYGHVVYAAEPIPSSVSLAPGAALGKGVLDAPISEDGCKRKQEHVSVLRIGELDPSVAVAAEGAPASIFVLGSRCSGYPAAERWTCLLQPLAFRGVSYTGARYPAGGKLEPGATLGEARLGGRSVTAVELDGVDPAVAVGVDGRPGEAFVAPGVCPYERFAEDQALDNLRRCLQGPLWLVFDPPGAKAGKKIVARADRPVPTALAAAPVVLARLLVAADAVPADMTSAVPVGALAADGTLAFTVPDVEKGLYEAVVTCKACAQSSGGRSTFPLGSVLVIGKKAGSTSARVVSLAVGVLVLALGILSIVIWRKGRRGRL